MPASKRKAHAPPTPSGGTSPLAIEHVEASCLTPAEYNPRTIGEKEFAALVRGIRAYGIVDPIIARREDGLVLGGHQRLQAAEVLGITTVPVVYLDGLDDDEAAALNILLNNPKAQGEWDMRRLSELLSELDAKSFDATLTGFDTSALEGILTWSPDAKPDDAFGDPPTGNGTGYEQMTFTLTSEQADVVRESMVAAREAGPYGPTGNDNANGNALARIAEMALGVLRDGSGGVRQAP